MSDSVLRPGTYRLTMDVKNPCADRRKKNDWRAAPIISADTGFVVEALLNEEGQPIGASIISADAGNDWSCVPYYPRPLFEAIDPRGRLRPLFEAIAPNLVRVGDETRTPTQIAAAIRDAAPDLLAALEDIIGDGYSTQAIAPSAYEAARAAIAKAKGE